jgi:hypothetical protein
MSLVISPRVRNNRRWSDDQLKSKICSEVNFVSCFGFPPLSGCSQMLVTPFCVIRYCNAVPAGDQRTRAVPPGTSNVLIASPPVSGITAIFQAIGRYWSKVYESIAKLGETSSYPLPSQSPLYEGKVPRLRKPSGATRISRLVGVVGGVRQTSAKSVDRVRAQPWQSRIGISILGARFVNACARALSLNAPNNKTAAVACLALAPSYLAPSSPAADRAPAVVQRMFPWAGHSAALSL